MPVTTQLALDIKAAAQAVGFDLAGIAPVVKFPELARFPQWIAEGRAGDMKYLAARNENGELRRASLDLVCPWARSVVVCGMNYNTRQPYSTDGADPTVGWISRYAWSREDYHDSLLRRLRKLESLIRNISCPHAIETRAYVDTGPVVERVFAKYAGIGWLGKNTCLINQTIGSWLFLGVIITSLELVSDLPAPDRCGSCTRCIDACPTQALVAAHELDSTRCIAYLTIEKRGAIAEALRPGMGRQVFGCDICQDVCPWNRRAPASEKMEFEPRPGLVNPALGYLAEISEEEFRVTFRGSPIKRAKRNGLRRNALIAIGNTGDADFLPLLERASQDADPVIAETADWAKKRCDHSGVQPATTPSDRGGRRIDKL